MNARLRIGSTEYPTAFSCSLAGPQAGGEKVGDLSRCDRGDLV